MTPKLIHATIRGWSGTARLRWWDYVKNCEKDKSIGRL